MIEQISLAANGVLSFTTSVITKIIVTVVGTLVAILGIIALFLTFLISAIK